MANGPPPAAALPLRLLPAVLVMVNAACADEPTATERLRRQIVSGCLTERFHLRVPPCDAALDYLGHSGRGTGARFNHARADGFLLRPRLAHLGTPGYAGRTEGLPNPEMATGARRRGENPLIFLRVSVPPWPQHPSFRLRRSVLIRVPFFTSPGRVRTCRRRRSSAPAPGGPTKTREKRPDLQSDPGEDAMCDRAGSLGCRYRSPHAGSHSGRRAGMAPSARFR